MIGQVSKDSNCQYIVLVESAKDGSLIKSIKKFSENDIFSAVVNLTFFENILAKNLSQLKFFHRRTSIVTKEKFNLTALINQVSGPLYLTWMIFADFAIFPDLYIPVSSKVFFINSTPGEVSAKQVYHLKPGVDKLVITKWNWNSPESVQSFRYGLNLQKINFRNVSMDMLVLTPRENCQEVHGKHLLVKLECVHQDFLELMGARLNFSVNVVECQEKEHPFHYPNGSESELFLKLRHREVDFSAVTHFIRLNSGRNYMDFVWPTFVLKSRMYLKQGRLAGRWASYLRPLESSVWWSILIWIVVTGALMVLFEKLLAGKLKFNFSLILDFVISMLKALQVFCNQAVSDLPAANSIRIILFLKFFVVLIFFQAYCGYLVSSLTILVPRFPFKDLKGFFANEQYQAMTLRRGFHQFFINKVIGKGQREGFMLPQYELPETIQEAIDKLCKGDHLAFSEFRENLLNFGQLNCRISELPSPIARLNIGIAMPLRAPIKELLRRELLLLKSTGIAKRLESGLTTRSNFREEKSQEEFATVSMPQIFSIFILLGMGISFSIFVFAIELMVRKRSSVLLHRRMTSVSNFDEVFCSQKPGSGLDIDYRMIKNKNLGTMYKEIKPPSPAILAEKAG